MVLKDILFSFSIDVDPIEKEYKFMPLRITNEREYYECSNYEIVRTLLRGGTTKQSHQ